MAATQVRDTHAVRMVGPRASRPPPMLRRTASAQDHSLQGRGSALRQGGRVTKDRGFMVRPLRVARSGRRFVDTSG